MRDTLKRLARLATGALIIHLLTLLVLLCRLVGWQPPIVIRITQPTTAQLVPVPESSLYAFTAVCLLILLLAWKKWKR